MVTFLNVHSQKRRLVRLLATSSKTTMSCPECKVFDRVVSDCIDPCFEIGPSSTACEQYGCLNIDTTSVQSTTDVQTSISAHFLGLSEDSVSTATLAVIVVAALIVIIILIIVLVTIWRSRRRRSSISNRGKSASAFSTLIPCFYHFMTQINNHHAYRLRLHTKTKNRLYHNN